MNRRQWLAIGAAGAGAAALGGWAASLLPPIPGRRGGRNDVSALVYAQSFPDLDGRPQPLAQWRGQILVLNFWATWCPPCIDEMPDLQAARDDYRSRGVEIVGIGIDHPLKIRNFRDRYGLTLPLLVAAADGSALGRELGNDEDALPYTALLDRRGRLAQRRIGRIRPEQLRGWLDQALA